MKKKLLSILLLASMLLSMIPGMALGTAAQETDTEVPRSETFTDVSDYYSLYKTEGLYAFFDALDTDNGTVDIAGGKWYAKVYNPATGVFEKSNTIYATMVGGAYDAEANPTGWRLDESGAGFGYDDPDYAEGAAGNKLVFKAEGALYVKQGDFDIKHKNWAIDVTLMTVLRQNEVAEGEVVGEALGAYRFGPVYAWRATNAFGKNAVNEGAGETRWCVGATMGAPWTDSMKDASGAAISNSFILNDGKVSSLAVYKQTDAERKETYTLTHGGESRTVSMANNLAKDAALEILCGEQGRVYAVRIYQNAAAAALNEAEQARNSSLDTLIRVGADLDKFNELNDALKDSFLEERLPTLTIRDKDDVAQAIDDYLAEDAAKRAAKEHTKYDELYVGADGSLTANGGKLTGLFTTYGDDASTMLEEGVWLNKMGELDATFGNAEQWYKKSDGGVGYRLFAGMVKNDGTFTKDSKYNTLAISRGSSALNTRLQLGIELLPGDDYTVEWVAKYNYVEVVDEAGESLGDLYTVYKTIDTGATNTPFSGSEYLGPVDNFGSLASWTTHRTGFYTGYKTRGTTVWAVSDVIPATYGAIEKHVKNIFARKEGFNSYDKIHSYALMRDEERFEQDATEYVDAELRIWKDGTAFDGRKMSSLNAALNKDDKYYDMGDDFGDFFLSSSLPTEFYAVRIYTATLTTEEMRYNRLIDLAAYAGADLSLYNSLDAATQASVLKSMALQSFTDKEGFDALLEEAISLYETEIDLSRTRYVKEGLTILTAAYRGFSTGAVGEDNITWFNAASDEGKNVTIRGGMELRANGGYFKMQTLDEWNEGHDYGYFLDADMLPEGDYTLELVMNPAGIMARDSSGKEIRYIDDYSQHGLHGTDNQMGFAIGPLRSLTFPAGRVPGSGGGMENRWVYNTGNRCWYNAAYNNGVPDYRNIMTDRNWNTETDFEDVITYNISYYFDEEAQKATYTTATDFVQTSTADIPADELISNKEAGYYFQLMAGLPGGMYSIRLYDRVLTELEQLQNRVADLIYFYELDTTMLDMVLEMFEDDPLKVYRGFATMGFTLPREQAQTVFENRLSALWLSASGLSLRGNGKDGVRFYFDIDEDCINRMMKGDYIVELGALVNVGQNATPTLDGRNYDYKIVGFDNVAGKHTGFFVDDDTFAVTISGIGQGSQTYLESINLCAYVRMVSPSGEEQIFYIEPTLNGSPIGSLFDIYAYAQESEGFSKETELLNYLSECTFKCYEKQYVYLRADAPDGGNGTKYAPYNNMVDALAACRTALRKIGSPTHFILSVDEGTYEVHEILELSGTDIPYRFCHFEITSPNSNATLTTTRKMDNSNFVWLDDEQMWSYQFEKGLDGQYPMFRNLYINGKIADLAHNGDRSVNDYDVMYYTYYLQDADGAFLQAKKEYTNNTIKPDMLFYPESNVEMNSRFAYYRDMYCAFNELKNIPAAELTLTTETALEDPTAAYLQWFEHFRPYWIVYNELVAAYKDPEIGKGLPAVALANMADLTTKTEGADDDFKRLFRTQLNVFLEALGATGGTFVSAKAAITPPLITDAILTPFSSGVFAEVQALLEAGELNYDTVGRESESKLAQGLQFIYYRDAFLALRDVQALGADPAMDAAPNEAGSEQYKALFKRYLYETIAIAELQAMKASFESDNKGTITWKARFAAATTAKENAPADYVSVFTDLRDSFVFKDFTSIGAYSPRVNEADGPYNGNIPMYTNTEQSKYYLNELMFTCLTEMVAAQRAKFAEDAAALLAEAKSEYDRVYARYLEALTAHTELLVAGKQTDADVYNTGILIPWRNKLVEAANAYAAAEKEAAMYLMENESNRYVLKDGAVDVRFRCQWAFNILHVTGFDVGDYMTDFRGQRMIAVYFDADEWAHNEFPTNNGGWYIQNRLVCSQNAKEYLDEEGEYYYDRNTGTLYYYGDEIDGLSFEYPTMDHMFYMSNIEKLTISNMAFTGVDVDSYSTEGLQAGQSSRRSTATTTFVGHSDHFPDESVMYIWNCYGMTITNCHFYELGGEGITMRGRTEDTTIEDNVFEYIGGTPIRISGSIWSDHYYSYGGSQERVVITNNYLNEVGRDNFAAPVIILTFGKDLEVSYNTISNCPYSGLHIGWQFEEWNHMYGESIKLMHTNVHHNYIYSFMEEEGDGGAIYLLGGNASVNESYIFNWNHDNYMVCTNTTGSGDSASGVYVNYKDGASSHWEDYNNIVVAYSYGAGYIGDTTCEPLTAAKFKEMGYETNFDYQEYSKRMQARARGTIYFYTQTHESAPSLRITYHDNFLINVRATEEGSMQNMVPGTRIHEAFNDDLRPGAPYYTEVKNMNYVKNPAYIPIVAENIIYEAGCDRMKGDPMLIAENNY